ncbi:hypothetical protein [uncultured Bacteroides sp.]|uniref:hypothetical protein n=1 Tax=uncultured Bacteroides sp. TaxID=162156 RepID=UPI002AAABA39|nr:hypothetical protein [uncultured Bacteroides sp.]
MPHHLNTNKQFMIGNGILAFAVIFVVVIFVYMSLKLQQDKKRDRTFIEVYDIALERGFVGDSLSVFVNDSLFLKTTVKSQPLSLKIKRFAAQSALMIVDHRTENVSTFDLSEKGGSYRFEKDADGIKQLAKK